MSAPCALLLHPFPLDGRFWERTQAVLEREGFTVRAPDLGCEGSGSSFASWARKLLAEVEGELIPVGVSMGGYLAFELWRQASERIRALVLVDTRATPDGEQAKIGRDGLIRAVRERGQAAVWRAMGSKLLAPAASVETVERVRSLALARPVDDLVRALEALRDREDSRPTLPTVDAPALVAVGELDSITPPADARAMVEGLPQGRLVEIPGSGHLSPIERPGEFEQALLGFLREVV